MATVSKSRHNSLGDVAALNAGKVSAPRSRQSLQRGGNDPTSYQYE
jgi:hypothetical protein